MTHFFYSHEHMISNLLDQVIRDPLLHAKWLNTLSYLENSGARKIAASEHPKNVKKEMLKHAAEEFRHALHLKLQIKKIYPHDMESYLEPFILGGRTTFRYLDFLEISTCRLLKQNSFMHDELKQAAYFFVTYGIELRAKELYTLYDKALKQQKSKVSVKALLLEEEEHLKEMENALKSIPGAQEIIKKMLELEGFFCGKWLTKCFDSLKNF